MKSRYLAIILVSVLLLIVVRAFAEPYRISGDCMEPAIKDGKLYFLNHVSPYLRKYQMGDIVVFKYDEKVWISRIVARETDTIQISEGAVVVNGTPLQESGIHRSWPNWRHGTHAIDNPLQVPAGHVYVLSDNLSAQHDDSRVFGPVPIQSITGLIW